MPDGGRRGRPPATSRTEVARAALALFSERGFDETTLGDVAAAAGVGRTTLFRYFDSKSAIVWEGLEGARDALGDELARVPAGAPWREALVAAVVAGQRYPDDDLEVLRMRLLLIGAVPALRAGLPAAADPGVQAVEAFVAERGAWDVEGVQPFVLAHAVWTSVFTGLTWWARSGQGDPRDVVRASLEAVLRVEPPT